MTFTEIVEAISERLNLSSEESKARVGKDVQRYYKQVTSEIGIGHVVKQSLAASQLVTIGNPEVTFTSCEKVNRVYYLSGTTKRFLDEVLIDDILDRRTPQSNDTPRRWAVKAMPGTSVTVLLDTIPLTAYALKADVYGTLSGLVGESVPAFPESFHDILIEGVLMDEYKKKKEIELSDRSQAIYEKRLSGLRMWVAKSSYLDIRQNGRQPQHRWWSNRNYNE